ncbi:MAG: S-layer homology domain-containing protein, partial [Syntrophomonadaceae bacterium]|nr:S-layer homology domain-containing protein [Syntrophomonadaceae bacterium]
IKNAFRKPIALLLALIMAFSLLPTATSAADDAVTAMISHSGGYSVAAKAALEVYPGASGNATAATVGIDDIGTILENIAAGYVDSSDPWVVIDMAAYARYNGSASSVTSAEAKQALIDSAIGHAQEVPRDDGKLAKDIVALQSVEIDPQELYPRGEALNLIDALDSTAPDNIYNVGYITLHAYRQGDFLTPEKAAALFAVIEGYANPAGNYVYDPWGYGIDFDTPGAILATVAPFAADATDTWGVRSRAVIIRDRIIAELADDSRQNASGSYGSANADSMVIVGLAAAGINPSTDTRFVTAGGKSIIDGLLSYALPDGSGFGYNNNTAKEPYATEQGFRALIAAAQMRAGRDYCNVYDFSANAVQPGYGSLWTGSPVTIATVPAGATVTVAGQNAVYGHCFDLAAGDYEYSVSMAGYAAKTGAITVTAAEATNRTARTVNVSLTTGFASGTKQITVYFTLVGDTDHDSGITHVYRTDKAALPVWIARTAVTVNAGASAFDVFDAALAAAGRSYVEQSLGYIVSIESPDGSMLSELDNGSHSGWMYLVNGSSPTIGIRDCTVSNGDSIVVYYTDDYTQETGSERWSGGAVSPAGVAPDKTVTETITPAVVVAQGTAAAHVTANEVNAAIRSGADEIVIAPVVAGEASAVSVSVPTASVAAIASGGATALTIHTNHGAIAIPNETLAAIASQADGADIEITVETKTVEDAEKAIAASDSPDVGYIDLENATVIQVGITSGGDIITGFGSNSLTVTLPVDDNYTEGRSYLVVVVGDDGTAEITTGTAIIKDGQRLVAVTLNHLTTFIVTYVPALEFTDVAADAWYYNAVAFAVNRGWFNGVGHDLFDPDGTLTRAMLVTVLYRLEGDAQGSEGYGPPGQQKHASVFNDVKAGSWYAEAVAWAAKNGIVDGYGDGLFGPTDRITREQMAAMLKRYADYKKYDTVNTSDLAAYTDADAISGWAVDAVKWAKAEGLITGTTETTLEPAGLASRTQAAAILMRFCANMGE